MIENKTNEITTIPIILDRLNIKDTIITWDVLNTQNKNSLMNLQLINKFCLAILSKVKSRYNMSLKKIRYKLFINFEQEFINLLCYLQLLK